MAKNQTSVASVLAPRVSRTDPCPDTAIECAPAAHSIVRPLAICTANAASLSPGDNAVSRDTARGEGEPAELGSLVDATRAAVRSPNCRVVQIGDGWGALLSGDWSLVDHADRDGKRWLVARRTTSKTTGLKAVERRVLALATQGNGHKQTAFALGISVSAACEHLHRGLRKLGLRSRTELVAHCSKPEIESNPT